MSLIDDVITSIEADKQAAEEIAALIAAGRQQTEDLDVLPPHERFGANPTGEELMSQDPNLSPFPKEHENAEDDRGKSRAQRFSRKPGRGRVPEMSFFNRRERSGAKPVSSVRVRFHEE